MAAIDTALAGPQTLNNLNRLAKRGNWASQEAGVIVVFCIVFIDRANRNRIRNRTVAVGLISLWIHKLLKKRKAARPNY
ncbi:MFS monocarboxylate transporter [Purpureocillium lavendulum]|uniref:MFS monocarboxylate transporter n=1 Tax=Purpureocillium lavendulum TaxID=1247861 RepID=A0AB34FK09_9HYPO|nr:MFS monocarboxylate transporter [Purpureocillium lavendulum]